MNAGITIMIVEDNPVNLRLVSDLLEFDGFQVCRCTDAEIALEKLKELRPDLILMDIALPGMDGIELTRILKSNEKTKDIKIIGLTAFAMKGDKERILEAGCNGYITKPIDTRKFVKQIMHFLY
jgi:two-component system, cell cycle response regulator DivK